MEDLHKRPKVSSISMKIFFCLLLSNVSQDQQNYLNYE